jgi:plasmid rolling circle replication initiator protein Rep
VSPREHKIEVKRLETQTLGDFLKHNGYPRLAERMSECSKHRRYKKVLKPDGTIERKLTATNHCRVSICPVCSAARANAYNRRVKKIIPKLLADGRNTRFLMMTLTVKNPHISELKLTVKQMSKAWRKFRRKLSHIILGDIRRLEVPRGKDHPDNAHPHYHCLIEVSAEYFDRDKDLYLTSEQFGKLWAECLGVDYIPSIEVTAVKPKNNHSIEMAIDEAIKYCTKPSDLLDCDDWTLQYMEQMKNIKTITTSGTIRQYLSFLEEDPDDYIGKDDEDDLIIGYELFVWDRHYKRYILIEVEDYSVDSISTCSETVQV